tara:strand:+ start:892 stop:1851 length:960 start_codon:yes stop_codon:yes gene_type:complete
MRIFLFIFIFSWTALEAEDKASMILITGASGTEEYEKTFNEWSAQWKEAADKGEAKFSEAVHTEEKNQKERLAELIQAEVNENKSPLWLVLIGHGTFDGKKAKFNLQGPDISATELKEWLQDCKRPLVIINCASSSSPFMNALSGKNRVIITATRSGFERNFCRLGGFLAKAIGNLEADIDKDGQTSLLEAWLAASRYSADFYKNENRLSPEHPLLDDNGDGKGTPPDWFRGIRVTKKSEDPKLLPDGLRTHQLHLIPSEEERKLSASQRAKRDALDIELAKLRAAKELMEEKIYYTELEKLLHKIGRIYYPEKDQPKQ